ncbi:lymphotoxin-alpha isoform X2 [Pangasianodon hypophthalmus]|uniref:lymphotoxin-alpha isoform X2 n=1 Tax=Pangasianodon hypophthalmus TaxID=310915 RepID=UPI00147BE862|nr:lymphotoxin-alpha isoform X2 [Pangasianodon hypophthalmus]
MGEVFVVDSQATANLVPPKQQSKGTYVLYALLGLALLGVFLHGVLIYHLYQRISTQIHQEMIQFYKQIGENKTQDDAYSKEISPPPPNPKTDSDTKPAAFLHYNHYLKSDVAVMQWAIRGFPAFTHNFNYSNGCLIIPKDGFYYLFSKVSFKNSCKSFTHEIKLNSSRYSHHPLSLMTDRYSCVDQIRPHEKTNQISSYLGGVFKLYKKDKLFVSVSDLNNLIEGQQENFFGGFMI